ncbi:hypothetical protein [Mucilaginibacter ginsenosidivorans]|uniref:Uncharacterized protein n=1 Tax=Mucilaginibacter ginsenosidivorans TaxID=398053 RepID=A0A5B8UUB7_9SPHI|nr:hypothetical protein [Mucilaginibacter ginsenosidivorans]QEC62512.1 hypothetical protein FRZ54_07890 [Mucilaginibacter ginsenosidivorans]
MNYVLWHKNHIVYNGICYEDRMDARLNEHEVRGLVFDEYDFDDAKPREKALTIERKLIRRDRPKCNICYNN